MPENTPTLKTERLILRKFSEADLPALFDLLCDAEVNTFLPWFPMRSLKETEAFFRERYLSVYTRPRGYQYAVCLKKDDIPIGYIHAAMGESHDFGYALAKSHWHQGITTEAGHTLIGQLRHDGVPYITATHDKSNPRSGMVMQRLGMRYEYTYEELWQLKNKRVFFRMYQLNLDRQKKRVYRGYWNASAVRFVETELSYQPLAVRS